MESDSANEKNWKQFSIVVARREYGKDVKFPSFRFSIDERKRKKKEDLKKKRENKHFRFD